MKYKLIIPSLFAVFIIIQLLVVSDQLLTIKYILEFESNSVVQITYSIVEKSVILLAVNTFFIAVLIVMLLNKKIK